MKCRRPHKCRTYSGSGGRAPLTDRPYYAASSAEDRPSSGDAGGVLTATAPWCVVSLTVDSFVLTGAVPGRLTGRAPWPWESSLSDDRGSAQSGQPPHGTPP